MQTREAGDARETEYMDPLCPEIQGDLELSITPSRKTATL
jgi:hypothetical protein